MNWLRRWLLFFLGDLCLVCNQAVLLATPHTHPETGAPCDGPYDVEDVAGAGVQQRARDLTRPKPPGTGVL